MCVVKKEIERLQDWLCVHCECTQLEQCKYCYALQVLDELGRRLGLE